MLSLERLHRLGTTVQVFYEFLAEAAAYAFNLKMRSAK